MHMEVCVHGSIWPVFSTVWWAAGRRYCFKNTAQYTTSVGLLRVQYLVWMFVLFYSHENVSVQGQRFGWFVKGLNNSASPSVVWELLPRGALVNVLRTTCVETTEVIAVQLKLGSKTTGCFPEMWFEGRKWSCILSRFCWQTPWLYCYD